MGEVRAIKITNPLFVGQFAPKIQDFVTRIAPIGITYETMYAYLTQIAQFGKEDSELWIAMNEAESLAFATWHVRGLPHIGKVYFDYAHNWSRRADAMAVLLEQFREFGLKHNAPLYELDTRVKAIAELARRYADKEGYEVLRDENLIQMMVRKKANEHGQKRITDD